MRPMKNPSLVIAHKRDGEELSTAEIEWFIARYASGEIPDYQMAALAMAIYLRGMTAAETTALTAAMLASGKTLKWSRPLRTIVDKHSTGGVGDKVSLILAPLLAASGLGVPKLSGRGLGATGGTLDKLESIPGFRTDLAAHEIRVLTERVGCVITGTTADLVPADRKLYALRHVTATVSSIPLITASIMSKKLAEGLSALVLDVKYGSGAFMKSLDQANELARSLVSVGRRMELKTTALVTDMNQVLGQMAGGAVEVDEAIDVLSGRGPEDVRELTLELGAELLVLAGKARASADARHELARLLDAGDALAKFREMVTAQGGDLDRPRPRAPSSLVEAQQAGYLQAVDTGLLGQAIVEMGGGRKQLSEEIDRSVGLEMLARVGDRLDRGQPVVRLMAQDAQRLAAEQMILAALKIGKESVVPPALIAARVTAADVC